MLTRLLHATVRRWVVEIDYHQPAPWPVIDSYHMTRQGAEWRCRQALRPLALMPKVATITVRRTL